MRPNALFAEQANIVMSQVLDMATTGGISTPAINMRHYDRVTFILFKNAGTAGDDPTITVTQGDGISSGALTNGKNLATIERVHTKRHASAIPKVYTSVSQAAAATFTSDTLAEEKGMVLFDITADMLDADNGFYAVRAAVADVGANAQLGVLVAICWSANLAPPVDAESNT